MKISLKLGVVGSRRRSSIKDKKILKEFIRLAKEKFQDLILISGGCKQGADKFAEEIALEFNLPIKIYYPDISKLPKNPKRYDFTKINYERNTLIANECEVLIALVADNRLGGTEHVILEVSKLNKKVITL